MWCQFRRCSRCARSRASGTASAHTTATSVPIAIITLVWYTGEPAGSVVLNVTSSCARAARGQGPHGASGWQGGMSTPVGTPNNPKS